MEHLADYLRFGLLFGRCSEVNLLVKLLREIDLFADHGTYCTTYMNIIVNRYKPAGYRLLYCRHDEHRLLDPHDDDDLPHLRRPFPLGDDHAFHGRAGSFYNTYKLNEPVPELLGVSVLLDGRIDAFRGDCPRCGELFEIGARIVKGRVAKVWIVEPIETLATIVTGSSKRGKT